MGKLALVDFDGVIADIAEHTRIAQARAKAFALEQVPDSEGETERKLLSRFFYSERGFFDPRLTECDQLMPGCEKAFPSLVRAYDKVIVLTSRPPSMREATLRWFAQQCPGYETVEFMFKDFSESIMKTATWKSVW